MFSPLKFSRPTTDWSGFQSKIIQRTVSSFLSLKVANGTNDVSLVMAGNSVE